MDFLRAHCPGSATGLPAAYASCVAFNLNILYPALILTLTTTRLNTCKLLFSTIFKLYRNDYWTLVDEDKDLHKYYVYVLGITKIIDGFKSWDSNTPSHLQSSCHNSKNISFCYSLSALICNLWALCNKSSVLLKQPEFTAGVWGAPAWGATADSAPCSNTVKVWSANQPEEKGQGYLWTLKALQIASDKKGKQMPVYRKSVLQTFRHRITELFGLEGTLQVISHLFYSLVAVIC